MSEEKNNNGAHSRSPFDDPERSRVVWHDVKKTGAAFWLGLESLQEGLFGPVPSAFRKPLADMRALALEGTILFDDLAILAKLRFGLPAAACETVDRNFFTGHLETFRVLTDAAGLLWRVPRASSAYVDPTYGALIIANVAWFFGQAAAPGSKAAVKTVSVGPKSRVIFSLSRVKKDVAPLPPDLASPDMIFSPQTDRWGNLRLPATVISLAAGQMGFSCFFKMHARALEIILTPDSPYEKKRSARPKNRAHRR